MDDFSQLTTPAFLVDRNAVAKNCDRMRKKAAASHVIFRPHVKTHKTIEIARMQHGGAIGPVTVSTLAEAELLAEGGWRDITYAFPIAPAKLPRAAELAQRVERLNLLIDSPDALQAIESSGHTFDVFLKVDCGYHRAGVDPRRPESLALAKAMAASKSIRFRGLLTHAGHSYNVTTADEVLAIAAQESAAVTRFWEKIGEPSLVRSIGSTPTLSVVEEFQGTDEVRPGNYVFYDAFQATLGSCRREDVAVSVLTTVVGAYPERDALILDAGALALSKDLSPAHIDSGFGYGQVCDLDLNPLPMTIEALSQEHGKVKTTMRVPVGTRLRVLPNHSCLTAAMFDVYHVVERRSVVAEWRPVRGW